MDAGGVGLAAFGGAMLLVSTTAVLTAGMSVAIVGGWVLLVSNLDVISGTMNAFQVKATTEAKNADGWNWSIQSKAVNHRYFRSLFWEISGLSSEVEGGFPNFGRAHLEAPETRHESESSKLITELKLR